MPTSAMQETATAIADWVLILPVVIPLMAAALLLMLRAVPVFHGGLALAAVAGVALCDYLLVVRVLTDGPIAMTMGNWLPPFGISFAADIMGAGFALVAAAVTFVVLVYMQIETHRDDGPDGFYPLVLLLLCGVSGGFLTGDLFNLYVWFEVMLIAAVGLLVFRGRNIELDATVKYGFINVLATTFFLISLGLLYGLTGTLNMADVARVAQNADPVAMTAVAALLLLAFGIKSAAFPVNAWLPASYHAPPAAVSALLAGLLTKVGLYALLRILVGILPESRDVLEPVIVAMAVGTMLFGALGAIADTNLRRALGFIVIGGIGVVLAGLAMPGLPGLGGAVVYAVHAMVSMTALYLVAGLIERATGTTDTRRMGGLYAANSLLSIVFLVLILGVAGVPPFLGFWPKLLVLQAGLASTGAAAGPDYAALLLAAAVLLNALLTLVAGGRMWSHIFWRPGAEGLLSEVPNPGVRAFTRREAMLGLGAAGALTAAILLTGLWPNPLLDAGQTAAAGLLDTSRYAEAVDLGEIP